MLAYLYFLNLLCSFWAIFAKKAMKLQIEFELDSNPDHQPTYSLRLFSQGMKVSLICIDCVQTLCPFSQLAKTFSSFQILHCQVLHCQAFTLSRSRSRPKKSALLWRETKSANRVNAFYIFGLLELERKNVTKC